MTTTTGADNAAVRDDPPVSTDFGLVTRVISDTGSTSGALQNGARTATPAAAAAMVIAANAIAPGITGSRVAVIIQNVGTENVCVGIAGVTATTGLVLVPNAIMIIEQPNVYPGEVWAIGEVADSTVFAQEILLS